MNEFLQRRVFVEINTEDQLKLRLMERLWRAAVCKNTSMEEQLLPHVKLLEWSRKKLSYRHTQPNTLLQGEHLESLCRVVIRAALPGFERHGAIKFTGHCGSGERLFAVLPQEEHHLLALLKHGPHKQVVEIEGDLRRGITDASFHRGVTSADRWESFFLHGRQVKVWNHSGRFAISMI